MSTKLPWIIGFATFVVCLIFFNYLEGPRRCNSGWESPSIGRQGACSHHGGVAGRWSFGLAIAFGIGGGALTRRVQNGIDDARDARQKQEAAAAFTAPVPADRATTVVPSKPSSAMSYQRHCGTCSSGMRAVNISVGPPPHGSFWECLNPECKHIAPRDA